MASLPYLTGRWKDEVGSDPPSLHFGATRKYEMKTGKTERQSQSRESNDYKTLSHVGQSFVNILWLNNLL
jgi:hypothetical protein